MKWVVVVLVYLAHVAVLIAAACALEAIEGPGVICPGVCYLVPALLVASLVRRLRVRTALRRAVYSLVTFAICLWSAVGFEFYSTRPGHLFTRFVADPCPASVQIHHSCYVGGRDPAAYLHFSVDPADFPKLLETRNYKVKELQADDVDRLSRRNTYWSTGWWRPDRLHAPIVQYSFEKDDRSECFFFWTDPGRAEVYFEYVSF